MSKKNKKKFITAIGIFLLLGLVSCDAKQEDTSQVSVHPTVEEAQNQDKLSTLPDKIQDILYKDGKFYDVERKQTYRKSSYQIDLWDYGNEERKPVYWEEYLVLDLDGDGQKELLVRVKNKDFSELSTRIFDVEQDTVYCYSYVFRATIQVYADGAIRGSSGASDWQMYSLKFKNGKAKETIIAEMESRIDAASKYNCFIGTQKVSSDELFAFMEKYNSQDGEKWITFDK